MTRRDRDLVRRAASLLTTGSSLDQFFAQACSYVGSLLDADDVSVALLQGGNLQWKCRVRSGRLEHGEAEPVAADIRKVAESGSTLLDGGAGSRSGRCAANVAISFGGKILGAMSAVRSNGPAYTIEDAELLETFAIYVGLRVHDEDLRRSAERLGRLAMTDSLTGIANRRAFDDALEGEFRRAARTNSPLSLVLIDIDHFKSYNDTHGHVQGDVCIRRIAEIIARFARRSADCCARFGGEEFALVLPQTRLENAVELAEKVRAAVAGLELPHAASSLGVVTVSAGVSTVMPSAAEPIDAFVREADEALYRAKSLGRNRVASAESRPPITEASIRKPSLPTYELPFSGRARELGELAGRLRESRFVSVTGPAGIGKTRLVVECAHGMQREFEDGIWFVDVESLSDSDSIRAAISNLSPERLAEDDHDDGLTRRLETANALVILDGCDDRASEIRDLIATLNERTIRVRVVTTSTEPLDIECGSGFSLAPMRRADASHVIAGSLPARAPGGISMPALLRCGAGNPLALTLLGAGAARSASGKGTHRALEERAEPPPEDAVERALRRVYEALDPNERTALRALSAHQGTWSKEGAVGAARMAGLAAAAAPDCVDRLVDVALVQKESRGRRARYRVHRSVARGVLDGLSAAELNAFRGNHASLIWALVERLSGVDPRQQAREWLEPVREERDNIETALSWCLEARASVKMGTEIVVALSTIWARDIAFARRALYWQQRAIELNSEPVPIAALRNAAATVLHALGRYEDARTAATQALALYQALGDAAGATHAKGRLACVLTMLGEVEAAGPLALEAFEASLKSGDRKFNADMLRLLATLRHFSGDRLAAVALNKEAISLHRAIGDDAGEAIALNNLAELAFHRGDFETAIACCEDALRLFDRGGDRFHIGWQLANLGLYRLASGDLVGSKSALREALDLHRYHGHRPCVASCFDHFAHLAAAADVPVEAARFLGIADRLYETGVPRQPHDEQISLELRASLSHILGAEALSSALAAGKDLSLEDAIEAAYAL